METRRKDRKLKIAAERIIRSNEDLKVIHEAGISYVCLLSDYEKKEKGRTIFAECHKVSDKDKWAIPYDFEIIVYEPNVMDFSKHQMDVLLEHELMHIGIDMTGTEPKTYIVPHDVEDFWKILDTYGRDWQVS